jgi:D-alanyl-D-alanine carboxypeptidase/D-alanyl-D-alanine-endopeptidase (penicillin-binding protein 4)
MAADTVTPTTESSTTTSTATSTTTSTTTTTTVALAPAPAGFVEALQGALADARFESATVGLSVWIEGDGVVFRHNADAALKPGSNEKLLVAWGAYGVLGPETTLVTDVRVDGEVDGSTVRGNLVLVGGGDPSLTSTGEHSLDRLATLVRSRGITEVTGDLVVDESRFDSERRNPGWTERHVPVFVGPLSSLAVDGNWSRTDPDYIADPAAGNLSTFRAALAGRGVNVAGGERPGSAPDPGATVASVRSAPVAELAHTMLTNSDNFYAEILLKEVGFAARGKGTTENGIAAVRRLALENGVTLTGRAADGSGLSRDDTRPAREWMELLVAARDQPWFDEFLGALPLAGRTGTLASRFLATPAAGNLRAKTGSVRDTRALSGYLTTAGGRGVVFSLVVNSTPVPAAVIAAMDNLVATMAANR